MKKRSKGQSTIEFTILMSFMILMFSVFFVLVGQKLVDLKSERNYEIAKTIRDLVSNEFQLAKIVEVGYTRQFKLPGSIEGMNYKISITNDTELNIDVGGKKIYMHIPEKVTGNISKGLNEITKQEDGLILIHGFISNISGSNCNCGVVDCTNPTKYYYDWINNTCYYRSATTKISCNYDGSCRTGTEICSSNTEMEQGASTGISRMICTEMSDCTDTTGPTLINITGGLDPYIDCGVGKICDGLGVCTTTINNCILDTSLINSCLLV